MAVLTASFCASPRTSVALDTAQPVPLPTPKVPEGEGYHRYLLPADRSAALVCALQSEGGRFWLAGLDKKGRDIVISDPRGPFQALVLSAEIHTLEVRHEGKHPTFTLECSRDRAESVVKSGYAVRGLVSAGDYLKAFEFGSRNWGEAKVAAKDEAQVVRTMLARLVGLEKFGNEPVVMFVGIAGLARILIADADGSARPDRDNMAPVDHVWVAYLEDDGNSYETTVDVQFNRSSRIKYDQFEPGASPLAAAAVLGRVGAHPTVRVGIKRISMTLPMSMQVAFTRQGGLYGFRQWQKSLRVRRWWVDFSVAAFVPAAEVTLNTHALVPTDFPIDGSPDFNVIVQESRRRQVFAALRLGWPGVRAATEDAPTTRGALKTAWIPDLVLGIGIPPTRATAAYVGLSLPVPRVPRLHLTAGSTFLWQSRLRQDNCFEYVQSSRQLLKIDDPLSVGCKVPLEWTRRDIVKGSTPVGEFVFGVIVDLFTWP
jgi:hypothetical protein